MQKNSETVQPRVGNWVVRNVEPLKTFMRTILGVVWLIDGALKFQPGFAEAFPDMVTSAGQGQPSWLQPWFSFWATSTTGNPAAIVYTIGTLELLLGLALVLGFLRKLVYIGGMVYSLFIWAVSRRFWRSLRARVDRHWNGNNLRLSVSGAHNHKRHLRNQ